VKVCTVRVAHVDTERVQLEGQVRETSPVVLATGCLWRSASAEMGRLDEESVTLDEARVELDERTVTMAVDEVLAKLDAEMAIQQKESLTLHVGLIMLGPEMATLDVELEWKARSRARYSARRGSMPSSAGYLFCREGDQGRDLVLDAR
jgi:hypothetical protein